MTTHYLFSDQIAKGCPKEYFTRRWGVFQKALAFILKKAIALIDACGEVVSLQSCFRPAQGFKCPGAAEAYRDFFRQIPRVYRGSSDIETIADPLGFPVSLTRLDSGCYLLLGGPVGGEGLESPPVMPLERPSTEAGVLQLASLQPEAIAGSLSTAAGLFNELHAYFSQPSRPALLSVIERLEQLIVSACDPEIFDPRAIFELITSCLVLIAGGGCAFAFSYEYPGRMMTFGCGEQPETVQALAGEWKRLGERQDPGESFAALFEEKVANEFRRAAEGVLYENNGASVYLGFIGAAGIHLREALRALVGSAAMALGISLLWTGCQESWKTVLNSIRQGIIVVDNRGAILIMNPAVKELCRERGITPVIGTSVKCCRLGPQIEEALLSAAGDGCSFMRKRTLIDESGAPLHLCWDVLPLLRDDGRNAGAVLVYDDITVTVRLQEEIRKWERLATAGEIAASLAHEVRNPLATAKAAIHLLRMDKTPLKREELLEKLDLELDRTNNILTNFLNISRPMADEEYEPVFLGETLRELLFFLNGEAVLKEIDLVADIPAKGCPAVLGSSSSIKQVCLNIALNAIEAMSRGGRLTISLFQREARVYIRFEDNGPGIPEEHLEALTRPFFTTKPGGTGLGLAISAAILEAMEGKLKIESSVGAGTIVELSLPVLN